MFALAVSCLIKLHVRRFAVELHILLIHKHRENTIYKYTYFCFSLSNHDGRFQMAMKNDYKLVITRLEEKMFDVGE